MQGLASRWGGPHLTSAAGSRFKREDCYGTLGRRGEMSPNGGEAEEEGDKEQSFEAWYG